MTTAESLASSPTKTLIDDAAAVIEDAAAYGRLDFLGRRVIVKRDPSGMNGTAAVELAAQLRAPIHELIVVIARLTDRPIPEVAREAAAALDEPSPAAIADRPRSRPAMQAANRYEPTGVRDLDRLIAGSPGGFIARTTARLIEPRLGSRDPTTLKPWERDELVGEFPAELLDQALGLLAEIRARPYLRAAWNRSDDPGGLAPAKRSTDTTRQTRSKASPLPDRRVRLRGEHDLGETQRRLLAAKEIPMPATLARRLLVTRDPHAQRNAETDMYEWRDMLGLVQSSFKPTIRCLRYVLGLALLLRESDHHPNPEPAGRRTVISSYNTFNLAATGRPCQHEEYDFIDEFLAHMVGGVLRLVDERSNRDEGDYSWEGVPLEAACVLRPDGSAVSIEEWRNLSPDRRGRRGLGGSGPSLVLTFTETFYAAVMNRQQHLLIDKQAAWAARQELVTLVRLEAHTGLRRRRDHCEMFTGEPMLRTFGIHGREQRANELVLEDDLDAVYECWNRVASPPTLGDAKNGYAWLDVHLDRHAAPGLSPRMAGIRTRNRRRRREARAQEHPERIGRRRHFAPPGTAGRTRQRSQARARKVAGRPPIAPSLRRRRSSRSRHRAQRDLNAASDARAP